MGWSLRTICVCYSYHDWRCASLLFFNHVLISVAFQSLMLSGGFRGAFFGLCVVLLTAAVTGFWTSLSLPPATSDRPRHVINTNIATAATTTTTVQQNHSDLSDQSALKIRVRIWVRVRIALFSHFSRRIRKVSTLYSANFTDGNILLTERTHIRRFPYSRSARA